MRKRDTFFLFCLLLWLIILIPYHAWSQLVMGQYEDEAPFRTWNTLGAKTASSLAMGETHFSLASDCSIALSNPALLVKLPKITFTLNTSLNTASLFKYSFVNTGVVVTEENIKHGFYIFDFAGFSLNFGNWAFALSWAQVENYVRPKTRQEYTWQESLYYFINLDQKGSLKNINLSIARNITKHIAFGLGLNFIYGHLKKDITESWVKDNITITDNKSHEFNGLFLNGGLYVEFTEQFHVAAVFRTPFVKKSESQSSLRYSAPAGETDITIEASSNDTFKQPLVLGVGASYTISENLRVASDIAFYNWSQYSVDYFEEPLQRNFKDIIKIGVGVEYWSSFRLFSQNVSIPLRGGLSYDPQPMKDPNSSYLYFSFGTGLRLRKLILDVGTLVGKEWGSGNSLQATKIAISLGYQF